MDDKQLERFGEAVEEKKQKARAASEGHDPQQRSGSEVSGDHPDLTSAERPQDTASVRAKSAGKKKKKTADKWNQ